MGTLIHDLRYGLRVLKKKPGFTAVAVLTLALGVGANTAIFTVVNAVLLRPLPYPEPERVMAVWPDRADSSFYGASQPKFIFWRNESQSFDAMAATTGFGSGVNLSGGDEPEYATGIRVSVDFFRVLGVSPALGRAFTDAEDSPVGERVTILSDGIWRRRFGADPGIIGKSVSLGDTPYTVVGVMPAGFKHTTPIDVIVPLRTNPASREGGHNYTVLARLGPGVTAEQAAAEMRLVFDRFKAAYSDQLWRGEEGIRVGSYQSALTQPVRQLLFILLGAVGFVVLIACANVASLQLAHAAGRRKEIAVRLALGAGAGRIVRQLLTEGVLLAMMGAVAGLLIALWGVQALALIIPDGLVPRSNEISFDWRVLAFTMATAIATGLVFALAPALQAARMDMNDALKEGTGKGIASSHRTRLRSALVVAEVALALMLLVGAGLLIRTFANLRRVAPGFDSNNVLTLQVAPNGPKYDTTAEQADYFRRSLEKIKGLPGVQSAAATSNLPLDAWLNLTVEIAGRPDSARSTEYRIVTPEYFRALGIALKQGREFAETDTAGTEPVAIVNEAYARSRLKDSDPFSHRLMVRTNDPANKSFQIVGIVNDVKQFGLNSPAPPTVFVPLPQVPDKVLMTARSFVTMKFVVRTTGDPMSLSAAIKQELLRVDPDLAVINIRSLDEIVSRSVATERFNMTLLAIFAAIGLTLAAVGIYGVISYSVTERTHEIGIRIALGARTSDVLRVVVGQGMILAAVGMVIGLGGAFGLTRLMSSFLFEVSPTDPLTFAVIALLLAAIASVACYIPARRATRVDPMVALRYE
jgi:putative ABC transport system permease protein